MFDKFISLFRSASAPPASVTTTDGTPLVAACDRGGTIWTRLSTGAGGGSVTGGIPNADALVPGTIFGVDTRGFMYVFNGVNWDRLESIADNADAQAALTLGLAATVSRMQGFNGATFDRLRTASAALAGTQPKVGVIAVERSGDWSIQNAPAAGIAASVTKAAIAGTRHICTSISADASGVATGFLVLRDGVSGVGAIIWQSQCVLAADYVRISGLAIAGTVGNAMTLEFTTGDAGIQKIVSLTGFDTV